MAEMNNNAVKAGTGEPLLKVEDLEVVYTSRQEVVQAVLGGEHWYSVLLACLVGIPMYADIFGAIPIAEALLAKGAGLGTVVSFMMSVTALSLPSMIMLAKAMKPKLLAAFIAVVSVGIILIGYLFNAVQVVLI